MKKTLLGQSVCKSSAENDGLLFDDAETDSRLLLKLIRHYLNRGRVSTHGYCFLINIVLYRGRRLHTK